MINNSDQPIMINGGYNWSILVNNKSVEGNNGERLTTKAEMYECVLGKPTADAWTAFIDSAGFFLKAIIEHMKAVMVLSFFQRTKYSTDMLDPWRMLGGANNPNNI